jgi:uncharacterized membrane protein
VDAPPSGQRRHWPQRAPLWPLAWVCTTSLYNNGFLAAGLGWALKAADPVGFQVKVFFLTCVSVAGLYGAATVNKQILWSGRFQGCLLWLRCC